MSAALHGVFVTVGRGEVSGTPSNGDALRVFSDRLWAIPYAPPVVFLHPDDVPGFVRGQRAVCDEVADTLRHHRGASPGHIVATPDVILALAERVGSAEDVERVSQAIDAAIADATPTDVRAEFDATPTGGDE